MIQLSPVAQSYYGFNQVSEESITNYGYALLSIAGADDVISEEEEQWFYAYFVELLFIPQEIADQFADFDFKNADLQKILPLIKFETELNVSLLLIYDSIRMSMADREFDFKEKQLVGKVAKMLNVPDYKVKTIEGLVNSENSLIDLRKGLFEVDKDKAPQKSLPDSGLVKHNAWVRMNFGHTYTTYDSLKSYCELLMVISGSDGKVSDAELTWLELTALAAGTPQDIINGLKNFDYKNTTVEELLPKLVTDTYQNLDRISLYLAVHMASADGEYAEDEHKAVLKAAELLKIETDIVDYVEHIVDVERSLNNLKFRLLK